MHKNTTELAKKFLDGILYQEFIISVSQLDEKKHYGDWLEKVEKELDNIVPELGFKFFTTDFINRFTQGSYTYTSKMCKEHPCLTNLDLMLDDYYDWLCNLWNE